MKVSIITVCFNSEHTIRDAIESVLRQTYSDTEYILIDGASTDNTLDLINEYSGQIHKVVTEPDKGIYDAMNKGINLATGDIIGILNSDDFYPHDSVIEEVISEFYKTPGVDVVLGGVDFVRENDLEIVVRRFDSAFFKPWKLRFGLMPPHPGAFIRRETYQKIGSYKLGYDIGADFDFFVRAFLVEKLSYKTVGKVWVRMRMGGVSTSGLGSFNTITREILRSFKENNIYTNTLMVSSRAISKVLQLEL